MSKADKMLLDCFMEKIKGEELYYNSTLAGDLRLTFYESSKTYGIVGSGIILEISMPLHVAINEKLKELGWIK